MLAMIVTCSDCKQVLWSNEDEPPPDAVAGPMEARQPCSNCDATARTFELSATAGVAVAAGGSVVVTSTQRRLRTYGYSVRWTEPTGPDGAWMVEVFDGEGKLIGGGLGDDLEDAILGVAERLLPPDTPETGPAPSN